MKEKIKVAFIYHKNNIFLTGRHFDNTYYNFFINALERNKNFELYKIPINDVYDCSKLNEKFQEFIEDLDNPKWEKIANEGGQHALKNLNNDKAAKSLELFIKDFIK